MSPSSLHSEIDVPGLIQAFDAAVAENRSEIHYQPVMNVDTGSVAFVEALFRCPDESGRHISNGILIPALRDGARMAALTQHLLPRVIEQAAEWRSAGLADRISLNVPSELLGDQGFLWWLIDSVVGSDIAPGDVLLEISGDSVATQRSATQAGIRRLAFAGFQVALDVPVLEYSDLWHMSDWTLHLVKVNRAFIGDPRSIHGRSVLGALSWLCSAVELEWAVVGVETAEEMQTFKESGARVMQGFHLAPPMDAATCSAWLAERNKPSAAGTFEIQSPGHC